MTKFLPSHYLKFLVFFLDGVGGERKSLDELWFILIIWRETTREGFVRSGHKSAND